MRSGRFSEVALGEARGQKSFTNTNMFSTSQQTQTSSSSPSRKHSIISCNPLHLPISRSVSFQTLLLSSPPTLRKLLPPNHTQPVTQRKPALNLSPHIPMQRSQQPRHVYAFPSADSPRFDAHTYTVLARLARLAASGQARRSLARHCNFTTNRCGSDYASLPEDGDGVFPTMQVCVLGAMLECGTRRGVTLRLGAWAGLA